LVAVVVAVVVALVVAVVAVRVGNNVERSTGAEDGGGRMALVEGDMVEVLTILVGCREGGVGLITGAEVDCPIGR
jgi:hypothetical protein